MPSNRALAVFTGEPVDIEHGRNEVALDKPTAMLDPLVAHGDATCPRQAHGEPVDIELPGDVQDDQRGKGRSCFLDKPTAATLPGDVHTYRHVSTRDLSRGKVATLVPGIPWTLFSGLFAVVAVRRDRHVLETRPRHRGPR